VQFDTGVGRTGDEKVDDPDPVSSSWAAMKGEPVSLVEEFGGALVQLCRLGGFGAGTARRGTGRSATAEGPTVPGSADDRTYPPHL
jgi:hypothetical protein